MFGFWFLYAEVLETIVVTPQGTGNSFVKRRSGTEYCTSVRISNPDENPPTSSKRIQKTRGRGTITTWTSLCFRLVNDIFPTQYEKSITYLTQRNSKNTELPDSVKLGDVNLQPLTLRPPIYTEWSLFASREQSLWWDDCDEKYVFFKKFLSVYCVEDYTIVLLGVRLMHKATLYWSVTWNNGTLVREKLFY